MTRGIFLVCLLVGFFTLPIACSKAYSPVKPQNNIAAADIDIQITVTPTSIFITSTENIKTSPTPTPSFDVLSIPVVKRLARASSDCAPIIAAQSVVDGFANCTDVTNAAVVGPLEPGCYVVRVIGGCIKQGNSDNMQDWGTLLHVVTGSDSNLSGATDIGLVGNGGWYAGLAGTLYTSCQEAANDAPNYPLQITITSDQRYLGLWTADAGGIYCGDNEGSVNVQVEACCVPTSPTTTETVNETPTGTITETTTPSISTTETPSDPTSTETYAGTQTFTNTFTPTNTNTYTPTLSPTNTFTPLPTCNPNSYACAQCYVSYGNAERDLYDFEFGAALLAYAECAGHGPCLVVIGNPIAFAICVGACAEARIRVEEIGFDLLREINHATYLGCKQDNYCICGEVNE